MAGWGNKASPSIMYSVGASSIQLKQRAGAEGKLLRRMVALCSAGLSTSTLMCTAIQVRSSA